ncbi:MULTISPECIES: thiolase family protein [unclassified Streptomyces]|uniref:thiolase family protein n=1 Tax=unclassified Streptomyces TaxID=2593676 RepID=UPI002DDB44B5|nr:thiolase family protein [Streptomyces sp. NBC_01750]WSB04709.1 thiolase family protein [Streptomyces sp. NBC_01794]WSD31011.1 thiolase family protein [Streptomyces sp. NBC_01750]
MLSDIAVVQGARTPVGRYRGALRSVPAHRLGALVIQEAMVRAGVELYAVDEVVLGCVGQVGPDAFNARRAALAAGLPVHVRAYNVNRLCGSGVQAVWSAAQTLALGEAEIMVAGGNESMTRQPLLDYSERAPDELFGQHRIDGTVSLVTDPFAHAPMGMTGECVARRFSISRERQDRWAAESQRRAAVALAEGRFADQIVPVITVDGAVGQDEHPRPGTTLRKLEALAPAFTEDGTITAGNSAGLNDGAAAVVLMRGADLTHGTSPLCWLRDTVVTALEPEIMGFAPAEAIRKLLRRTGLFLDDIQVIELNEAFAAQVLAVMDDLKLEPDRVNPNGGAIALGHPIGATGTILLLKAAHELRRTGGRFAVIAMCIGGGQGIAALIENPGSA